MHLYQFLRFRFSFIKEIQKTSSWDRKSSTAVYNLPSTCPPVFFTSSSAISTPTNTSVCCAIKKLHLHWLKSAEKRREKIESHETSSKPFPQKQNRRVHVIVLQARASWRKLARSTARSTARSIQNRSWNVLGKMSCLQYFPFWTSIRCASQVKFASDGIRSLIPTFYGNGALGSSANDAKYQRI